MPFDTNTTVVVGTYTKASDHNKAGDNTQYLRDKGDVDHDMHASTATGHHRFSVANPMHWKVSGSTTWTAGWWQASDGSWWLLVRAANVASFTRGQADFYIPTGDIVDVPAS